MAHTTISISVPRVLKTHEISAMSDLMLPIVGRHSDGHISVDILEPKITAKIVQDKCPGNPRVDWDNAGVMWCKHRNYTLGDKDAEDPYEQVPADELDDETPDDGQTYRVRRDIALILPLYLYDHSGITMSHGDFGDRWDSGQVGWHYMTKTKLDEEFDGDKEKGKARLKAELETYDSYIRGQVWGYEIENEDGDHVDSCWGFYGDELAETGILDNANNEYHDLLKAAWEERFE